MTTNLYFPFILLTIKRIFKSLQTIIMWYAWIQTYHICCHQVRILMDWSRYCNRQTLLIFVNMIKFLSKMFLEKRIPCFSSNTSKRNISLVIANYSPISDQCSSFIPPENTRKSWFLVFSGGISRNLARSGLINRWASVYWCFQGL